MRELLQAYYRENVPGRQDAVVTHMEELRAGWESEIHFFDVDYTAHGEPSHEQRVLRIYPGEVAAAKATAEFQALLRLRTLGYPVPQVYALATGDSPLGQPFMIMERVPGTPMWQTLFHVSSGAQQEGLLEIFCGRFVELHRMDWRAYLSDGGDSKYDHAAYPLAREMAQLDRWVNEGQLSEFQPALAWLGEHRAAIPAHAPAVVHLDFHPNNILLGPENRTVVLDWTQAGVSDPRLDLGWTLVLVGAAQSWEWRDRILACYERLSGESLDEIAYFEAFACIKRLGVVALALRGAGASLGLRSDMQEIILRQKRSLCAVYDRLVLLTGLHIQEMDVLFGES